MQYIDIEDLVELSKFLEKEMKNKKNELNELDGKIGDGDLGITMVNFFKGINEFADDYRGNDIGEFLIKGGISANNKASSTMGTLLSSALMEAGKQVKGKDNIDIEDFSMMIEAGINNISEKGGAEPGDKTLLDVLIPINNVIKNSINKSPKPNIIDEVLKTAEENAERTKNMIAQHGRAAYYKEKSKGKIDPGAKAVVFLVEGIKKYINDSPPN
ncbi:dihydroxyacetone kinase, C-terminal domain [Halarsenatibacter silvermanii]|uniref:phosphoenolpyruvate--glycerone phosphotransferase n=2 Tax=Halarsenatibacter silvermanii TaxID=321763 RepID=A0A1G9TSI8_9FIRM|nr:dihydroxyacetone kinase, C-terminal domain [Halarsenatibacter silvermanii]